MSRLYIGSLSGPTGYSFQRKPVDSLFPSALLQFLSPFSGMQQLECSRGIRHVPQFCWLLTAPPRPRPRFCCWLVIRNLTRRLICYFDIILCYFDIILCYFDIILCYFNSNFLTVILSISFNGFPKVDSFEKSCIRELSQFTTTIDSRTITQENFRTMKFYVRALIKN